MELVQPLMKHSLYQYILSIADNTLILGQRLGELCGHGPSLETDIACTNIALDLLGQTRTYFQYAAKVKGDNTSEDSIAFLRTEGQYVNVLLVEQPNDDFAHIITRQFLFDAFHHLFLEKLKSSLDVNLSAIANKAFKEVTYHIRFSSDWVLRLGDGTQTGNKKMQQALNNLWPYTLELFETTQNDKKLIEEGIAVPVNNLEAPYYHNVKDVIQQANLKIPETKYFHKGGKHGRHTEHMGYILSDMQYMQRTYPNMNW